MTMDFSAQRLSYEKGELTETRLPYSPLILLQQWFDTAINEQVIEPYAMSLATCGQDMKPSVRTVLLREVIEKPNNRFSLIFYTNYDSQKGQDLAQNPNAQVLFFWHALERQVRISGGILKVSSQKSQDYFLKRPHDSQVAAWVSKPQSGLVASREIMEAKFAYLSSQYPEGEVVATESSVPMPPFWGGYELEVESIEFWQGRANRMHDRILYTLSDDGWQMNRLLP